jgi:hypothetical protein
MKSRDQVLAFHQSVLEDEGQLHCMVHQLAGVGALVQGVIAPLSDQAVEQGEGGMPFRLSFRDLFSQAGLPSKIHKPAFVVPEHPCLLGQRGSQALDRENERLKAFGVPKRS